MNGLFLLRFKIFRVFPKAYMALIESPLDKILISKFSNKEDNLSFNPSFIKFLNGLFNYRELINMQTFP